MNGELSELYNKISSDFTAHQAEYKERWDNHDKRATELMEIVKEIKTEIKLLPCPERKWIPRAVYALYAWIGTLTIAAIVSVINFLMN